MNIGISAFAWTGSFRATHLPLIAKAREYGFSTFEIPMFSPADLPVKALRATLEAQALEATVCAILPQGINPISADPQERKKAVQHLGECIEVAAEIGAHLLGGPVLAPIGYLPKHRPTLDEWTWAREACQALIVILEAHEVTLSLEPVNRSETSLLRTAAEARKLCSELDSSWVGVTLDTFHANIEERNIPQAIRELGPHLKHMHMSENDRGLLGAGHIDFGAICGALRQVQYSGRLIVEGFGFDPEDHTAPGYLWADLSVSPEVLATSGIQFLRSIAASS